MDALPEKRWTTAYNTIQETGKTMIVITAHVDGKRQSEKICTAIYTKVYDALHHNQPVTVTKRNVFRKKVVSGRSHVCDLQ